MCVCVLNHWNDATLLKTAYHMIHTWRTLQRKISLFSEINTDLDCLLTLGNHWKAFFALCILKYIKYFVNKWKFTASMSIKWLIIYLQNVRHLATNSSLSLYLSISHLFRSYIGIASFSHISRVMPPSKTMKKETCTLERGDIVCSCNLTSDIFQLSNGYYVVTLFQLIASGQIFWG